MNELKQVNPYETPLSPSSRRRFNFLIYGSMIGVVLIVSTAAALIFSTSVKELPNKQGNRVFMERGPVRFRDVESPSQAK